MCDLTGRETTRWAEKVAEGGEKGRKEGDDEKVNSRIKRERKEEGVVMMRRSETE